MNQSPIGQATAIVAHENAVVSNNKILGFYNGITADGQATIKGNVIDNCGNDGISCVSANVDIENNYLVNNHIGISAGGTIENNAIVNNVNRDPNSILTSFSNYNK